ncbi:E3 ubiquitin-protein ligase WAV3-like [Papaver somniferum]|uniref:E3 ubiquitin-protein ligase WAV3-like n=1 Tax=Papaver somniferum TaxID=3469 RepID=UPI000E6FD80A|nr:E3 ubiquitin-protein ligase WAV3-like [Papaver somniferum]
MNTTISSFTKMENEIHNDDEQILMMNSEEKYEDADVRLKGKRVVANITNKTEAPLEKCQFNVLVELKGIGAEEGRLGVDLVTVLDISGSMDKEDRFADKLCPLRRITETSQTEITDLMNKLESKSTTNTEAGLRLALKILNDRTFTENRSVAIMLMSDGIEDEGISNATSVPVLSEIAKNRKGGTFTYVPELNDLSAAFSTSLAGLLSVAIEDLTLTAMPMNGTQLNKMNAGIYSQVATQMEPVSFTVKFSSLFNRETRKVLAELTLPEVGERVGVNVLRVELNMRVNGKEVFASNPRDLNVSRKQTEKSEEKPEVR